MVERLQVIAAQAVTYIVLIGVVLGIVVEELAPYEDNPAVAWVIRAAGAVIVTAGVAAAIIRRVTPVLPHERGILPQ